MFALRDTVIAELKTEAGENWRESTLGNDVVMAVGSGRGMSVILRDNQFHGVTPQAAPILDAALKKVQNPTQSGDTVSYTSLRTGERVTAALVMITQIRVLIAPETRENQRVNAAHFEAAERLGLVRRGDDEHHVVLTDEGKDALKAVRLL